MPKFVRSHPCRQLWSSAWWILPPLPQLTLPLQMLSDRHYIFCRSDVHQSSAYSCARSVYLSMYTISFTKYKNSIRNNWEANSIHVLCTICHYHTGTLSEPNIPATHISANNIEHLYLIGVSDNPHYELNHTSDLLLRFQCFQWLHICYYRVG